MSKIIRPAALVRQGNLKLYTTSLRVEDLLTPMFYDIARLDPDEHDKGFQRLLNQSRAKKLANYLIDGQREQDGFLPTSIFLATDKDLEFDEATNTITIDIEKICPFGVVDGQHRVEGLKLAAEKVPELRSFEVPVNIAVNLTEIAQMCHFLIVNTTQKAVDQGVEQRIYARLTSLSTFHDIPTLPGWVQRIVEKGEDRDALVFVDHLNTHPDSPWKGKIEMANQEDDAETTITQRSFAKSLKKYVLVQSSPIHSLKQDEQKHLLLNYWRAVCNLLVDPVSPKATVVFKNIGVEVFSRFSVPIFHRLFSTGIFTVKAFEDLLRTTFDNISTEYSGSGDPSWWQQGGPAGKMNASAQGLLVAAMNRGLNEAQMAGARAQF